MRPHAHENQRVRLSFGVICRMGMTTGVDTVSLGNAGCKENCDKTHHGETRSNLKMSTVCRTTELKYAILVTVRCQCVPRVRHWAPKLPQWVWQGLAGQALLKMTTANSSYVFVTGLAGETHQHVMLVSTYAGRFTLMNSSNSFKRRGTNSKFFSVQIRNKVRVRFPLLITLGWFVR